MSIFTKADAALPIITQLMQVNLNDEAELLRFWRRAAALVLNKETTEDIPTFDGLVVWRTIVDLETIGVVDWHFLRRAEDNHAVAKAAGYETTQEYLLALFREACVLAVQIVVSVYFTHEVPLYALVRLQKLTSRPGQQRQRATLGVLRLLDSVLGNGVGGREENGDLYLPLGKFNVNSTAEPHEYISDEVCALILSLKRRQATLEKCPICDNIYTRLHGKREFCSLRCGRRSRQRKPKAKI